MDEFQDKRLERIEAKLDDLSDHLSEIDITLVEQHSSLKEHMRRSDLLEKRQDTTEADLKPIKRRMNMFDGVLAMLGMLGVLATLLEAIRAFKG